MPIALYDAAMDMEELSKSQIILLTLLVSFVTSIATGIVTVSLMNQAPPAIAQTVNRIIERKDFEALAMIARAGGFDRALFVTIALKEGEVMRSDLGRVNPRQCRDRIIESWGPRFLTNRARAARSIAGPS